MKTKNSFYNFIARLVSSILPSLLGIVLNNLILTNYGSDINGLTATISQFIVVLTIFEGGFTLATNVALYKPYLNNEIEKINRVLSATRSIFIKIGFAITFLGVFIAFLAPYFLNSQLDKNIISALFIIALLNMSIQFLFTQKYNIMFHVAQKEYVNTTVTLIFLIISQIVSIISILNGANIIFLKLIALIIPLLRMPLIIKLFKKNFPGLSFKNSDPDYSVLKTTKDVVAQKFTSLIFGSTDLLLISILISTLSSSVYAIYNMIYTFLKTIMFSLILAPFNAFGQLFADGNLVSLRYNYKIYQFVSIIFVNMLITTATILILPFMELYTKDVFDIEYVSLTYAVLFALYCALELISSMLGALSNSSGDFKNMKKITILGAFLNISISLSLISQLGISGVLLGTVISYIVMISFQLYLVHVKTLEGGLKYFLRLIVQNVILSIILFNFSNYFGIVLHSYFDFLVVGAFTFISVSFFVVITNIVLDFKTTKDIFKLMKNFIGN